MPSDKRYPFDMKFFYEQVRLPIVYHPFPIHNDINKK